MPLGLTVLVLLLILARIFSLSYCCVKYAPERNQSPVFGNYVSFIQKEVATSS